MTNYSLAQLAEHIGATVKGDTSIEVSSLATLADAGVGQISFLANPKYKSQLAETKASAVLVTERDAEHATCACLICKDPYVGFAKISQLLDTTPRAADEIAPSAVISEDAELGENVAIGANAVIESGVKLGDNVQIGPGCFIGKDAVIGDNTKMWANVTIYHDCKIGHSCLFQSGAVIGSDGFGYANDKGDWIKVPQTGSVLIGNRVEIGANTTIDRGALGDTIISDGVILDNLIQIAHNVVIGKNTAMAACGVIAGSTIVGENCVFAGMVGVNGHIEITDRVTFTGFSMVTKSVKEPGVYSSGIPATTNKEWRKSMVGLRNLSALSDKVKKLEKALPKEED